MPKTFILSFIAPTLFALILIDTRHLLHSWNLPVDIDFSFELKALWFLAKSTGPVKMKRDKVRT